MKSPVRGLIFIQALLSIATTATEQRLSNETTNNDDYPTCGDCFCVPDSGAPCPYDEKPETDYSTLIPILKEFTWNNPMSLDCDPYLNNTTCDTNPPLEQGGACLVDIAPNNATTTCPTDWTYDTRTYERTYQEALNEGLYVTHSGACGTCSSLQDLAAYMETGPELQDLASTCGIRGQFNKTKGIQCFLDLGFTLGCANIWYYNTVNTRRDCLRVCVSYTVSGNGSNLPPPSCDLAACINCDEVNSGDIFKQYAGRTRRNSGLLSGIVRNCSEIIPLQQENPCDSFDNGTAATSSASKSMTIHRQFWNTIAGVGVIVSVFGS